MLEESFLEFRMKKTKAWTFIFYGKLSQKAYWPNAVRH